MEQKSVRIPTPEEVEKTCNELTTAPIPCPSVSGGKKVENSGVTLSMRRRKGWREDV